MTEERRPLAELLAKAGDGDFRRRVAEAVVQLLMESDVEGLIGAGRHERSGERTSYRNGYRDRALDTRLGTLQLRIPKLRQGRDFPPFLEPRKTSEKALVAVIQDAWVGGVSTRRVDELVQAMGLAGISKSPVSKLCKDIDDRVNAFLDRPLTGDWPYLWLDATSLKQREGGFGRLTRASRTVRPHRLGRGDNRCGRQHRWQARDRWPAYRPIRGRDLLVRLPQEHGPSWPARRDAGHLRRARGPEGGDPPCRRRLLAALPRPLAGLYARRPFGHGSVAVRDRWMRNALAYVPKGQPSMVAAALRQAFIQPDRTSASQTLRHVADQLRTKWPKLGAFIDDSEADVLAHMDFPFQHRSKIHSTNPLERLNKAVKCRADGVGIFPNEGAIIRLIGAVLLEANDEWQLQHRSMQTAAMAELTPPMLDAVPPQISTVAA